MTPPTDSHFYPKGIEKLVCDDITTIQIHGSKKSNQLRELTVKEWLSKTYQETLIQAIYLKRAGAEIEKDEKA